MIIARGNSEGVLELLMIGLSRENVNRLVDEKPINLTRESHGKGIPEGWNVVIFFGETETDCVNKIQAAIRPQTVVHIDSRIK